MSKYSNELKLEVVKYYLEEHHSLSECSKKINIKHREQIRKWIKKYELYGYH